MLMKKDAPKKDDILSNNENQSDVMKLELDPKVFNLIDNPNHETNCVKDTIKILNDQKNFMLHLEAVRISTPVT
jgi:peptide subunit release factor RF-3